MKNKKEILEIAASVLGVGISLFCMLFFNTEIHTICPFATVCTGPLSVEKKIPIFAIGIIIGVLIVIVGYFIGRIFCGYICPIGQMQRLADYIAEKLKVKKIVISDGIIKYLEILKYIITFTIVMISLIGGYMFFIKFCPIYMFSSMPYLGVTVVALTTTIVIFVISFKIRFFFCRFLCPYSVVIKMGESILKYIGFKKLKSINREEELCVKCGVCEKKCPVENKIIEMEKVENTNCILCMKCVKNCPLNKKGKEIIKYK